MRLRYVSINGQLRKMLLVVKMRRSRHSIDMVEYQILPTGIVIGERLRGYSALTSGIPRPSGVFSPSAFQADIMQRDAKPDDDDRNEK